jgi:WD40 repeat protein/Tfp pilus assembly protein PilF
MAAALGLLGGGLYFTGQVQEERNTAQQERDRAVILQQKAEEASREEKVQRQRAEERLVRANVLSGVQLTDEGDLLGSLPWFAEALKLEQGGPERGELHRIRLAAVLSQCPWLLQLWTHPKPVQYADFSPDGHRVVTACADGTMRVWNTADGEAIGEPLQHSDLVHHAAFNPDGLRVVTASRDQTARIWEVATGKSIILKHEGEVQRAAFSPDGSRVLTTGDDGKARLWDAVTGKPLPLALQHGKGIVRATFSPDGRRILTASLDHTARMWDAATGEPVGRPLKHDEAVWYASFSPDGRWIVTASQDHSARVWEADTGKPITGFLKHGDPVVYASFSPDSKRVVTAGQDRRARVWVIGGHLLEMSNREEADFVPPLDLEHSHFVHLAVFSPDGRQILTASEDQTAMVWDAATGKPVTPPLKHGSGVQHAAFSPDGRLVLTASMDQTVRVWDITAGHSSIPRFKHGGDVNQATFSPQDGRWVVTASDDRTARVWDAATGQPVSPSFQHENWIYRAEFSPDGRRVVTASKDGTARVWDAATGQPVTPPLPHGARVFRAVFSPDGRLVATAGADQVARVWDATTGGPRTRPLKHDDEKRHTPVKEKPREEEVRESQGRNALPGLAPVAILAMVALQDLAPPASPTAAPTGPSALAPSAEAIELSVGVTCAAFSPDSKRLVTAGTDRTVRVWEVATGKRLISPIQHSAAVRFAEFSPDGKRLVTAGGDQAQVWDAATGERITPPLKHSGIVYRAAFSPDGRHIVTGSADRTSRVWDAATGAPVTPFLKHGMYVHHAAFSCGGRLILTAGADQARVWDATTGQPLTPPLRHASDITYAAFSPDARRILTASRDHTARVWDLPPREERPATDLVLLAEVLSGRRIDDSGNLVHSEADALGAAYQALRSKDPVAFASTPAQARAWHQREVAESEREGQWFAAAWHATRLLDVEPNNATLYYRRARAHVQLGAWSSAEADLTRAIKLNKADRYVWFLRGRVQAPLGHWNRAAADYAKALELAPQDGAIWLAKSMVSAQQRQWDQASADYAKAVECAQVIRLHPEQRWDRRQQSTSGASPWLEVMADLSWIIREGADAPWAWRDLALAQAALGQWREARDNFRAALGTQRNRERIIRDGVDRKRGKKKEGKDDGYEEPEAEGAAEPKSKDVVAWQGLARALAEQEEWSAALRACSEALALNPEDPSLWYLQGIIHAKLRQHENAVRDYSKAIDLGADGAGIRAERGMSLAELGQWKKAGADFAKSIDTGKVDEPVLSWLALAFLGSENPKGYRETCAVLLERAGTIEDPETANRLVRACVLAPDALADWGRLVQVAQKTLATEPENPDYLRTLAAALYRADRFEDAVRRLNEAIAAPEPRAAEKLDWPKKEKDGKKDGGDKDAPDEVPRPRGTAFDWLFLAMAHEKCGRHAEAQLWLNHAVRWMEHRDQQKPEALEGAASLPWEQRLALQQLHREAQNLTKVKPDKPG